MKHSIKNIMPGKYSLLEGTVYFELFHKEIDISSESDDVQYIQHCVDYMNNIDEKLLDELCITCIKYCNDFLDCIGEPAIEFNNIRDVLKLIYPSILIVPQANDTKEPVIHMELNCEWEVEHGMEWVIRSNKILYVGAYNGEDPWGDDWSHQDWNYAS